MSLCSERPTSEGQSNFDGLGLNIRTEDMQIYETLHNVESAAR